MFFKKYFNAVAETLDIKYRSYNRKGINSADIGELCELFIKEFLTDSLDDHYRINRGGNIINSRGDTSPQLDVIVTNRRNSLKIFGDKGIYPIETMIGVFSITSNLTANKLRKCIREISKIPKGYSFFSIQKVYGEQFRKDSEDIWRHLFPFSCVFGYRGSIKQDWINIINAEIKQIQNHSLWPTMIIVNKRGMFYKHLTKSDTHFLKAEYIYTDLTNKEQYGECFSRLLFQLYTMRSEQMFMTPQYENYFAQDF